MNLPPRVKKRRYGEWAGNPKGWPEDVTHCIKRVWPAHAWGGKQCSRKRGHGPGGEWCKQHAKQLEAAEAYKALDNHLKNYD